MKLPCGIKLDGKKDCPVNCAICLTIEWEELIEDLAEGPGENAKLSEGFHFGKICRKCPFFLALSFKKKKVAVRDMFVSL